MRTIFPVFTLVIIFFCSCKKNHDAVSPINCTGLVTDTTGTNDTARIYMPTAFSPSNDGLNDLLRPFLKSVGTFEFTLYDGNNNIVFSTNQFGTNFSPSSSPLTFIKYYYKLQTTTLEGHHIGECGEVYSINCFPSNIPRDDFHFEDQLTQDGFSVGTSMDQVRPNCQ